MKELLNRVVSVLKDKKVIKSPDGREQVLEEKGLVLDNGGVVSLLSNNNCSWKWVPHLPSYFPFRDGFLKVKIESRFFYESEIYSAMEREEERIIKLGLNKADNTKIHVVSHQYYSFPLEVGGGIIVRVRYFYIPSNEIEAEILKDRKRGLKSYIYY